MPDSVHQRRVELDQLRGETHQVARGDYPDARVDDCEAHAATAEARQREPVLVGRADGVDFDHQPSGLAGLERLGRFRAPERPRRELDREEDPGREVPDAGECDPRRRELQLGSRFIEGRERLHAGEGAVSESVDGQEERVEVETRAPCPGGLVAVRLGDGSGPASRAEVADGPGSSS